MTGDLVDGNAEVHALRVALLPLYHGLRIAWFPPRRPPLQQVMGVRTVCIR